MFVQKLVAQVLMGNSNRVSAGRTCDDCQQAWEYKCKANVHFHCSQHYFERLQLGTLPHRDPSHWESRSGAGVTRLEPVVDFQESVTDSKTRIASSVPAPVRSIVLKSTSKSHMESKLSKVGISCSSGISREKVTKAHTITHDLRKAIIEKRTDAIDALSSQLMELIPQKVQKVETEEQLLKQIEILELLDDIVECQDLDDYEVLLKHCSVDSVAIDSPEAQIVHSYLRQNMSHNMRVVGAEIFRIARHEEKNNAQTSRNRVLLWHGSANASFPSILRYGLRLPKSASNGWAYGPGIYFADIPSKSLQYCCGLDDCLLALAEVDLGSMYPCSMGRGTEQKDSVQEGCQSTWGVGKTWPLPNTFIQGSSSDALLDGVDIPHGRPTKATHVDFQPYLDYNEFIVYSTSQVRLRYLIRARVAHDASPNYSDMALKVRGKIGRDQSYYEFATGHNETAAKIEWQYLLESTQDGYAAGWHSYDESLHKELEQRFGDGEENARVQSGKRRYQYEVDFRNMKQTNLTHHAHTTRNVRRQPVTSMTVFVPAGHEVTKTLMREEGQLSWKAIAKNGDITIKEVSNNRVHARVHSANGRLSASKELIIDNTYSWFTAKVVEIVCF